jgi:transposase
LGRRPPQAAGAGGPIVIGRRGTPARHTNLSVPKKLIRSGSNVFDDLAEQKRRDVTAAFHHPRNRIGLAEAVPDPIVGANIEADLAMAERLDDIIRSLERTIRRRAKIDAPDTLELLQTIPGIGRVLALTLLYEIHHIERFPRVGDFLSYARLVKSQKASAGKITGTSGAKIGNAHLKWAYSEAAVLFLQKNPPGQHLINRLRSKHGRGKALSVLAARIGRASYFMLRRSTPFDMDRFLN